MIDFSQLQARWPVEGNCPDCNVQIPRSEEERERLGRVTTHHDGCPVAQSLEEMGDHDRAFFNAHPEVDHFFRKPFLCEIVDMRVGFGLTHLEGTVSGKIRVQRMGPGMRARIPVDLTFTPRTEDYS